MKEKKKKNSQEAKILSSSSREDYTMLRLSLFFLLVILINYVVTGIEIYLIRLRLARVSFAADRRVIVRLTRVILGEIRHALYLRFFPYFTLRSRLTTIFLDVRWTKVCDCVSFLFPRFILFSHQELMNFASVRGR